MTSGVYEMGFSAVLYDIRTVLAPMMTCDGPRDILVPDTMTASPPCVMGTLSIEYTSGLGDAVCIAAGSPGSAPASGLTAGNETLLGPIARERLPRILDRPLQ